MTMYCLQRKLGKYYMLPLNKIHKVIGKLSDIVTVVLSKTCQQTMLDKTAALIESISFTELVL